MQKSAKCVKKVGQFSSGSLFITIPYAWARRVGVRAGDILLVLEHDGDLIVKGKPIG